MQWLSWCKQWLQQTGWSYVGSKLNVDILLVVYGKKHEGDLSYEKPFALNNQASFGTKQICCKELGKDAQSYALCIAFIEFGS